MKHKNRSKISQEELKAGSFVKKLQMKLFFVKFQKEVVMKRAGLVIALMMIFAQMASAERVYTLKEAINQALSKNYLIKATEENIKASVAHKYSATSAMLPKIEFEYNFAHLNNYPYALAMGRKMKMGDRNSVKWNITITQPIFTGFALSSMREIAKLGVELSKVYKKEAVLDLAENVKIAYFDILLAKKYLKTAKEAVEQLKAHVKDAENLYKQGMIPLNDLLKSKVALANAIEQETETKNNLKEAISALNVALNNSISEDVEIKDVNTFREFTLPLNRLYTIALNNNPLLKQLSLQLKQQGYAIKLAESSYYPQIGIFAQYQRSGYNMLAKDNTLSNDHNSMIGLQIKWDLFDSFKTKFDVEEQEHKKLGLLEKYLQTKKDIKFNVKKAYLELKTAEENIKTATVGLRQARENFRITNIRYKQNMTTSTEVLDARTYLTQAELNYNHALYGYYIALAKLKRAMGEY